MTHLDLGRQYESLPYAGMLFFAAVFRAHSFILTLRVDLGQNRVEDLEVYEFATRADGKQVVDALKTLHIPVA